MILFSSDDLVRRLRMVTGFIRFETGDRIAASACLSEEAADRIEQLAAINEELESNIKELFVLLERVEQSDEGRTFHPVRITCCRAMDTVKLEQVLRKLKGEKRD